MCLFLFLDFWDGVRLKQNLSMCHKKRLEDIGVFVLVFKVCLNGIGSKQNLFTLLFRNVPVTGQG